MVTFLTTQRKVFEMFTSKGDVDDLVAAGVNFSSVPSQMKRGMDASVTLASMYKDAWLSISRVLFQRDLVQKIEALEHLNFMLDEVETFKRNAMRDAERLADINPSDPHKKLAPSDVRHLTVDVATQIMANDDEWKFRLNSTLKTIGVNTGQLEMMPWERLLFKQGQIPGVAQTVKIPEELLTEIRNGRAAAIDVLGPGRRGMTLSHLGSPVEIAHKTSL